MEMEITPKERIFMVGCPRSGTTLSQSLLAAHPEIASFPECHFFRLLFSNRTRIYSKLKLASPRAKSQFEQYLQEIGHDEMRQYIPNFALFPSRYFRAYIKVLDALTQEQGKSIWIEKTPENIRYIDYIEKWLKGAKFIHIIRNGADVVASLYEITRKHPDKWRGGWSLDRCIRRWAEDVQLSHSYLQKPNHTLVKYEELVDQPRPVLEELCKFIDVEFDEVVLQEFGAAGKKLAPKHKPWLKLTGETIHRSNSKKFYELFDQEQRNYILQRLSAVSID